jgi:hypothetical protein
LHSTLYSFDGEKRRVKFNDALLWWSDFYGLRWTRSFTCKTLDAILFSCWVRLLFRGWMSRGISPLKNADGANFYADAVSSAYVPVNRHVCSVNSKLCWRLNRSPNVVTLMLTSNFSVFLEIWVYGQTISPTHRLKR